MLLTPKIRSLPARIVSLLETVALLALGFLLYLFVIPEAPPLEEVLLPPATTGASDAEELVPDPRDPAPPPPATTVRDQYEFAGGEIFFDDAVEPAAVTFINRATRNIRAVTYTIGLSPPVAALENAAARGVAVSVIAGRNGFERRPVFPLIELHPAKGILHEKFLVADDRSVLLTSRNLTAGQSKNAAILFHDAPKLAALLAAEFSALEEMRVEKRCETGCPVEHGALLFLPGKGCRVAKEYLLTAKKELSVAMYTMTIGTPLMTGLKKMLKNDRRTVLLLDDWTAEGGPAVNLKAANYLESMGATVLFDRLLDPEGQPMNFHHKFAIIDHGDALVFGSMNWTKAGCYRNREVMFVTGDGDIAGIFKTYFDDMLKAIAPERGQAHKLPDPAP